MQFCIGWATRSFGVDPHRVSTCPVSGGGAGSGNVVSSTAWEVFTRSARRRLSGFEQGRDEKGPRLGALAASRSLGEEALLGGGKPQTPRPMLPTAAARPTISRRTGARRSRCSFVKCMTHTVEFHGPGGGVGRLMILSSTGRGRGGSPISPDGYAVSQASSARVETKRGSVWTPSPQCHRRWGSPQAARTAVPIAAVKPRNSTKAGARRSKKRSN